MPGATVWLQPGHRYALTAAAAVTPRTTQRPSDLSSERANDAESGRAGRRCLLGRRAMPASLTGTLRDVRLLIARCQVDYAGRLSAHLPMATRLIMLKADGSVSIHADDRAYKPLNWMNPPCSVTMRDADPLDPEEEGLAMVWEVRSVADDRLRIAVAEVLHDSSHELGVDPGLQKDGVEGHLQQLLAEHPESIGEGWTLVRREHMTAIGPVDILFRDAGGAHIAVEVKRRGEIDGVEQLTRYVELMNADPMLRPVQGVFAAQLIKPQARVLAAARGISCVMVDYDALRGIDNVEDRLF